MDDDDLWLAETYGLNLVQRAKVRDAAVRGVIVDPDDLRRIVVAFAHRLLERQRSWSLAIFGESTVGVVTRRRLPAQAPNIGRRLHGPHGSAEPYG